MITGSKRAGHPPGLYVLFFTELWERYSFYSMVAILSLYMNEALHFDVAHVGRVYGAYTAGVYFLPLFGGLLADRVLGFNRAIIIGGFLMMCGHLARHLHRRQSPRRGRGRQGRGRVDRSARDEPRRDALARHHAARRVRDLDGLLARVLSNLLHLHLLGARQHADHGGARAVSGVLADRRD